MIKVIRYSQKLKEDWDQFVDKAKNGTFLFYRDYMEYHSDRFHDYSLMLYDKGRLKSIFPANQENDVAYSHQGLTFGGLITLYSNTSSQIIEYFNAFNTFLAKDGIKKVVYKTIPQIYKSNFGQEDEYIMFRLNAKLVSCNLSSVLDMKKEKSISRNRIRNYKKAIENNVFVKESENYKGFWSIMISNLNERYNAKPVHNISEILLLKERFPQNIKLFTAQQDDHLIGGAVLYFFKDVIKIQYAHASEIGKNLGAIDALYFSIIEKYKRTYKYLDFGSSNLDSGRILQSSLINQKEGFGARGVIINTYKYKP